MASHFKNRLVGVTILVTIVVIFLPSIIDGKKTTYQDEFVAMPIKPELQAHRKSETTDNTGANQKETVVEDEQWQIEEVAEPVVLAAKGPAAKSSKSEASKKTAPKTAWTIQLGAFQNAENINALLKKLHKAGFQAHTVPVEVIDGKLTRVFVGPDVSQAKLEKQLPHLKRLTQLEGKLMPFNAVNP